MPSLPMRVPVFVGSLLLLTACGFAATPATTSDASTTDVSATGATSTEDSTAVPTGDPTASDTAPLPDVPDGDPTRLPCTSNFGDALTSTHGRLDGILVAIVPPGESQCNGDDDHLHLQVRADDQIYDVAVNVRSDLGGDPDVHYFTTPAQLTGPAWAEGWHPDLKLDYPASLGVHADDFTPYTINVLAQKVEGALSTANHVSIYGTGYGPDGMHKIHRDGYGRDGAIVLEPLSGDARYLLFRFASQTF